APRSGANDAGARDAARAIDAAALIDALDRLDTSPCRARLASEVSLRGWVGRDGVAFELEAEVVGGAPGAAACVRDLVAAARLPAPGDGMALEFTKKIFLPKLR
ncbi:MAG TPA: hypothetical protein VG389_04000, partial [Myxococcota bacterium]|nr:hypothetical protein [Myxococcota bacterium]